jgi:hypothetical protein
LRDAIAIVNAYKKSYHRTKNNRSRRDLHAAHIRQELHLLKRVRFDVRDIEQLAISISHEVSRAEQADGETEPRHESDHKRRSALQTPQLRTGLRVGVAGKDDIDPHRAERIVRLIKNRANQCDYCQGGHDAHGLSREVVARAFEV